MKINSFYLFVFLIIAAIICFRFTVPENTNNSNAVILCEQFAGGSFPPTGWFISGAGSSYWERVTQSGFGVGTGSAKYDCWNAANGVTASLITHVFDATLSGDLLVMDIAYVSDGSYRDSLIISTSTNSGTTYTSFLRLGPDSLRSVVCPLGCPSPFVPTASQWRKHEWGPLPTGTNRIQFLGKSGFGDNIYIDSICIKAGIIGIGHNSNEIPADYLLSQNYPNPFNPATVISFGIPKAGNVKLIIYDNLGREIKTLINEFRNAGTYDISFDASYLASGIYFYKLVVGDNTNNGKAGDFTDTKKMILVK